MKITGYHRDIVARYYQRLITRFGLPRTLRGIRMLKKRVWTKHGLTLVERYVA